MPEQELNGQELMKAWEQGVEQALRAQERTQELDRSQLERVAGMSVASGIQGGLFWWTEVNGCSRECA